MIFVTVGNALQPFTRLLSAIDTLAAQQAFGDQRVLIQHGHTPFQSSHVQAVPFLDAWTFEKALNEADVVVLHGGCTVFQVIRAGKFPVVVPRERRFGEHINDHQLDFARALGQKGYVIPVFDLKALRPSIERAAQERGAPLPPSRIGTLIAQSIEELMAGR